MICSCERKGVNRCVIHSPWRNAARKFEEVKESTLEQMVDRLHSPRVHLASWVRYECIKRGLVGKDCEVNMARALFLQIWTLKSKMFKSYSERHNEFEQFGTGLDEELLVEVFSAEHFIFDTAEGLPMNILMAEATMDVFQAREVVLKRLKDHTQGVKTMLSIKSEVVLPALLMLKNDVALVNDVREQLEIESSDKMKRIQRFKEWNLAEKERKRVKFDSPVRVPKQTKPTTVGQILGFVEAKPEVVRQPSDAAKRLIEQQRLRREAMNGFVRVLKLRGP